MSSRWLAIVTALLACCRGREEDASSIARDPSTATETPTKNATNADASVDAIADANDADGAIALPAIDTSCAVDADCATTFYSLSGPYTCCWQCGSTAGNVAWVKRVEAICKVALPTACPSLACPSGPMHARCDAGKCVGVF